MPDKVLVVDDEPAVLGVMGRMLATAGFLPSMADSGEQALALLARTDFDAALVDKNLVGMDGIDVLRHVRRRQPRCACIVMTAYPSMGSAIEALRLGVVDYLEKPSPELDLIADRVQLAIKSARLQGERDGLAAKVTMLEAQLLEMEQEALQLRIAADVHGEVAELFRRRDEQLIRGAQDLLASARLLPKSEQLCEGIAAHLAALRG